LPEPTRQEQPPQTKIISSENPKASHSRLEPTTLTLSWPITKLAPEPIYLSAADFGHDHPQSPEAYERIGRRGSGGEGAGRSAGSGHPGGALIRTDPVCGLAATVILTTSSRMGAATP
jgi:hypothetical protein